jgi:putative DNA primase/helicase
MMDPLDDAIREGIHDAKVVPIREAGKRDLTQDGLALQLGDEWANDARHVAPWNRWLFFDGTTWRLDEKLEHMTRARDFLRGIAVDLPTEDEGARKALRKADTVAKIVSLARSNVAQAASVAQWDADPWVLGTPEGTVDLTTGQLRPALPEDYITKRTAVAPAPKGKVPKLWLRHLGRITGGNTELIDYHQRLFGYCLTGSIREHVFPFGYGTGANGKGVTLNTEKEILGDYAVSIGTEMLMVNHNEAHPTELARLRGVRLAIGSETEEGKRWAEAKIKRLTGGDPIAARFMRQDFFEFNPTFKLFVIGNHRPSLRGVDEAMRRRLHLVPFTVTIPEEERDDELPEKLRAEWPAILRWGIDGCLAWQRDGLRPPEIIRAATDSYLDSEDAFSLWVEECADLDPNAWSRTRDLFASWKAWAERSGEYVGSEKRLRSLMEERGFTPQRQGGTGRTGYRGMRLVDDAEHGGRP